MFLFDVNVLLSLFDPGHDMHLHARRWWLAKGKVPWCSSEITRTGFVRISSNPHATTNPKSPAEAWSLLESNIRATNHCLLTLEGSPAVPGDILRRCQGYRQVTDAFLIHLAIAHGAVLATFDQRLKHLSPDPDAVEVIPLL